MNNQSEFGKIKLVDVLNAIYYFIGTTITAILAYLQIGRLPTTTELVIAISTALAPAFLSIFKSAAKNSEGKLLKKENSVMSNEVPRTGGGGDVPPPQR